MADLGKTAIQVQKAISNADNNPNWWVDAYTNKEGWYRLDQAQRRLETLVGTLEEEPDEQPLSVVRRIYEDVCHAMAEGFTKAMVKAKWTGLSSMHQTRIFPEITNNKPKPVAYFLVDALRFEMGLELAQRLPTVAEVEVGHAFGAIPTITPIGMGALLPGASSSFSVVEQNGKFGVRIEDTFMPDLPSRKKFTSSRIPNLVDITLNDLLSLQPSKLIKRIEGGQVIIIRSQEIDHAGETGSTFQARQVMDTVIDNLARAIKKLSVAGVEYSVVTADHGHLFFAIDRDESMRTDSPGGNQIELHRRCWIGRGGQTPTGCVRVEASSLGYESDLAFVFPTGCGVFKAGGDLAYHHGGLSLQELVIPIISVRLKSRETSQPLVSSVQAAGIPDVVTNRIFSVTLQFGGPNLSLFPEVILVRPMLMADGRQVGAVGMAVDAELDRNTGCVKLPSDKLVTVAFLLIDETISSLRVVIQDPTTDAELYRSPKNIPVRLGV